MLIQFCIDLAMIWLLRLGTISLFMVCFKLNIIISRMVMLKFISLVLLFLIPLQFLLDNFITYCLRSKYSNLMVKKLRKFEKVDYSLWKCKLDLTLLITYLHNNIIQRLGIIQKLSENLSIFLVWFFPLKMSWYLHTIFIKTLRLKCLMSWFYIYIYIYIYISRC